ncbi:hypothetical protein GQ600_14482 [Phytophthora cactorum]|nr:hypothetical protein GQ600_14482 [Phytophthora cactorum]
MPHRVAPGRAPGLAQIRVHERIARLKTDKFSSTVLKVTWVGFLFLHFFPVHLDGVGDDWPLIVPLKDGIYWLTEQYSRETGF